YGPSNYSPDQSWLESGQYPYQGLVGGDGMQVQIDTTNKNIIYIGYQYGFYYRFDKRTGKSSLVRPINQLGEPKLRFNWQTPIMLSSFNSDFLYFGANKLFRSFNKGNDFEAISHDLTRGKTNGNVAFGTLSTIDESPLKFGILYTGSDDGLVHISKDGGSSWTKIFDTPYYISRVIASQYESDVVYITLNGYRFDDFSSYIYKSTNFGKSWQQIGLNLPKEPVNVIREDPVNPNVLYAGTDAGLYASIDKGISFMPIFNSMPEVPVHDIAISRQESELVAATHGRSLYKVNIKYIEKLTNDILKTPLYIFPLDNIAYNSNWGNKTYSWGTPNIHNMEIVYYSAAKGTGRIKVMLEDGTPVFEKELKPDQGLNYFTYDLSIDSGSVKNYKENLYANKRKIEDREKEVMLNKADNGNYYLLPGKYVVEVKTNSAVAKEEFEIKQRKQKVRE
ncbi:MAG: glycosyl hydrolase, partial [Bacteroidota bacterium]|nr:glycosyl hydrolase [Bacteroidota bacterium]